MSWLNPNRSKLMPIRYYGGKGRMAGEIISLIPEHTHYCEPFAGSCAVLFAKKVSPIETINDHNDALITFFRVLQDPKGWAMLCRKLKWTMCSRAEMRRAGDVLKDCSSHCNIDVAWAVWVQLNMAVGSKFRGSIGFCKTTTKVDKPRELHRRKEVLLFAHQRFSQVQIESVDALEFIEKYDAPGTIFYIDPPYPGADQGHYSGYTATDFAGLVSLLGSISGKFILSNYDQPGVPVDWWCKKIQTFAKAGPGQASRRTEVLWANFKPTGQNLELGL